MHLSHPVAGYTPADSLTILFLSPVGAPVPPRRQICRARRRSVRPPLPRAHVGSSATPVATNRPTFPMRSAVSLPRPTLRRRCEPDRFRRPGRMQRGTALTFTLALAPIQETVVVTATRTERPRPGGAGVTLHGRRDRAAQVPLVGDLLRTTPGATVLQTGGPGGVTSLFVRGGESNYNKVLLDGIPLNEPGGTFNFSNLTTENRRAVEVVRGAQSALFGSDAMSSVVQVFTKRGAGATSARPSVTAQLDGGSYGTCTHRQPHQDGRTLRLFARRLSAYDDNRGSEQRFYKRNRVGERRRRLSRLTRDPACLFGAPKGKTRYARPDRIRPA